MNGLTLFGSRVSGVNNSEKSVDHRSAAKPARSQTFDPELRLGAILLKRRYITSAQLRVALKFQVVEQMQLGEALLELGYISESQLKRALRRQCWARSLAAGIALITSPICPLFAQQLPDGNATSFKVQDLTDNQQLTESERLLSNQYAANQRFTLASSSLGKHSGFQLNLSPTPADINQSDLSGGKHFTPELSLFTTLEKPSKVKSGFRPARSDRYKNTIPAVIRLTLKGYCLMQVQGDQTETWSFNRVENKQQRKYELMFSITKHF